MGVEDTNYSVLEIDEGGAKPSDNIAATATLKGTTPAPAPAPAPASFTELLAYADFRDKTAIFCGVFAAVLSGLNQPAQLIVFGSLLNSFNGGGNGLDKINFLSLMYLILAIQMFICQFLQTSCMVYAASRQVNQTCHNLTRTCHNLTRTCHNLTRTCHKLNPDLSQLNPNLTQINPNLT